MDTVPQATGYNWIYSFCVQHVSSLLTFISQPVTTNRTLCFTNCRCPNFNNNNTENKELHKLGYVSVWPFSDCRWATQLLCLTSNTPWQFQAIPPIITGFAIWSPPLSLCCKKGSPVPCSSSLPGVNCGTEFRFQYSALAFWVWTDCVHSNGAIRLRSSASWGCSSPRLASHLSCRRPIFSYKASCFQMTTFWGPAMCLQPPTIKA